MLKRRRKRRTGSRMERWLLALRLCLRYRRMELISIVSWFALTWMLQELGLPVHLSKSGFWEREVAISLLTKQMLFVLLDLTLVIPLLVRNDKIWTSKERKRLLFFPLFIAVVSSKLVFGKTYLAIMLYFHVVPAAVAWRWMSSKDKLSRSAEAHLGQEHSTVAIESEPPYI